MVVKLTSIDQFEKVLNDNPNVFVMKHSSTCPISASAYDQFNKFLYERDMDGYYLIVQEERELSDYIADKTGINMNPHKHFTLLMVMLNGMQIMKISQSQVYRKQKSK